MPPPRTRSNSPMPGGDALGLGDVHDVVGPGLARRRGQAPARAALARAPAPPGAPRRSCSTRRSPGSGPSHFELSNPQAWQAKTVLVLLNGTSRRLSREAQGGSRSRGAPERRDRLRSARIATRPRRRGRLHVDARHARARCRSAPARRSCPPARPRPRRWDRRRTGPPRRPRARSGRSVTSSMVRSMQTVPATGARRPPTTSSAPCSRIASRARDAVGVAERDGRDPRRPRRDPAAAVRRRPCRRPRPSPARRRPRPS